MEYDLNEEQQLLKDTARKLLTKQCTGQFIREMIEHEKGYEEEFWREIAELGWIGLLIPEKYGGSNGSFLDMAVLLHEMGYSCLPGPFFSTAVLGVIIVLEVANDNQKGALLRAVAEGGRLLTVAWGEENGANLGKRIMPDTEIRDGDYLISGEIMFVQDIKAADTILCIARRPYSLENETDGVGVLMVDGNSRGISIERLNDWTGERLYKLTFDKTRVPQENVLGEAWHAGPILKKVFQKAAVAKCAEMCGGAERTLRMVVDYAKEREQFGRPIGSFQAIQHHCANMLTFADTSRIMMYQAAWRISEGLPFQKEASMCKAWVNESYKRLLHLGHQVMGGTGYMEEHDLHLYHNRAMAAQLTFGDSVFHREVVATEIGL